MASSAAQPRPQQPTDSPVASLPTETLAQILVASLEGLKPWNRQQARFRFSRVCSGWYEAAQTGQEFVVRDSKMANRLTSWLKQGRSQRRSTVRGLLIDGQTPGEPGEQSLAALLDVCPMLETLCWTGVGVLGEGHALGTTVVAVLTRRPSMRYFSLDTAGDWWVPVTDLLKLIKSWPSLVSLRIPNLFGFPQPARPLLCSAPSLRTLELPPLKCDEGFSIHCHLLSACGASLRHLDFGSIYSYANILDRMSSELMEPVLALAPQLHSFKHLSRSKWSSAAPAEYLSPVLDELRNVRRVELGISGFKFAEVLSKLQVLPSLALLSISETGTNVGSIPFQDLTAAAALDFLSTAPAVQNLTLPHQLEAVWSLDELEAVQEAATKKGVIFNLV